MNIKILKLIKLNKKFINISFEIRINLWKIIFNNK